MTRRTAVALLLAAMVAVPLVGGAQPSGKVYRVGHLLASTREANPDLIKAFEEGLRSLGYVEGRNLSFEYRAAHNQPARLPELASELVRSNVDVIVTGTSPTTLAAKRATATIPIVMVTGVDPVGAGLASSLARPEGNITGLTIDTSPEIYGKRLQLLREVVPGADRVAVLFNPDYAVSPARWASFENSARALGVTLQRVEVRRTQEFEGAFAAISRNGARAAIAWGDPLVHVERARVIELAARHRLPMMYYARELPEAGGLVSYGANLSDLYRRAATYVDKILKGARPGDLPIEQPAKFDLVINLRTAKALGLAVPESILSRADEVIP